VLWIIPIVLRLVFISSLCYYFTLLIKTSIKQTASTAAVGVASEEATTVIIGVRIEQTTAAAADRSFLDIFGRLPLPNYLLLCSRCFWYFAGRPCPLHKVNF